MAVTVRLVAVAGFERVFAAPTDVFVDDGSVLQPDVLVTEAGIVIGPGTESAGIPVLVVEILSPSTVRRDRDRKTAIYLRAGVREVWRVDPDAGTAEVHTTVGVQRLTGGGRASSAALPGFHVAWSDLSG